MAQTTSAAGTVTRTAQASLWSTNRDTTCVGSFYNVGADLLQFDLVDFWINAKSKDEALVWASSFVYGQAGQAVEVGS